MDDSQFLSLVRELTSLTRETEWVELKHNKVVPEEIGEYLSALSNSAALLGKPSAYILWGVEDGTRRILGTTFRPYQKKVGNEELENWLLTQLEPRVMVNIHESVVDGKPLVLFEVQPAPNRPVLFKGVAYIRIGSYKKKLQAHPEKERELWRVFERTPFEKGLAMESATPDDVLSLIDYPNYFRMMKRPLPENREAIFERLTSEKVIVPKGRDRHAITNVGAVLFARNLNDFDRLARKALRVIIYRGDNRVETIREQMGGKGYAIGFEGAISYINDQLPQNEQIGSGKRMANVTLRKRLGIKESSYTLASRIISDTIDVGLIRLHSGTRRDACYVPFWA